MTTITPTKCDHCKKAPATWVYTRETGFGVRTIVKELCTKCHKQEQK